MRTLEEAAQQVGVSVGEGNGLNLHFSPIPNWYMDMGFGCPRCDQEISWKWQGELPAITTEVTPHLVKPKVIGATLVAYGHRWICIRCNDCLTELHADNFD